MKLVVALLLVFLLLSPAVAQEEEEGPVPAEADVTVEESEPEGPPISEESGPEVPPTPEEAPPTPTPAPLEAPTQPEQPLPQPTVTPSPTAVPTATAVPARPVGRRTGRTLRYDPLGPDRDCGDFRTWAEAQDFYEAAGGPERDPHRLDGDGNGIACESLPGAPGG